MMTTENKKEVVEQRVKPTVIRRRAAPLPPPPPVEKPEEPKVAASASPLKAETPSPSGIRAVQTAGVEPILPVEPTFREKEEKQKKGVKRKKSKAELEYEDIQRAGGLKQFAEQTLTTETSETSEAPEVPGTLGTPGAPGAPGEWEPSVERVFQPGLQAGKRRKAVRREFKKTQITEIKTHKKAIRIDKGISIQELSQEMGIKSAEIIKKLMALGVMATANQRVDADTATLVATDFGYEVEQVSFKEEDVLKKTKPDEKEKLKPRAPVVTVMGHVDHGKTSLLDAIRKTKVTEKEAGGITQHIGAYEVHLPKGNVTFIDTPGHEAFTRMRARGAKVTDIVVLVVAADDGIMPQTVEAIDHAKAAGVPIVVAINKIDKPQADAEKVKRGLTEHGLVAEDWGGEVICVSTSAKSGQGLDQLLEMLLLVAQMQELKAIDEGPGRGVVIESRLEKGRGPVMTLLVQSGIIKVGDGIVAGMAYGKVRAMTSSGGKALKEAHPSQAVEVLGLEIVSEAGDELFVVEDDRVAKRIAEERQAKRRQEDLSTTGKLSLEALQEKISKGETHELVLIIKTDVAGSAEAVTESLTKLSTEKVTVKVIHYGPGGITENDVMLAKASKAVIVGFNVVPEGKARAVAEREGVDIRLHAIIYEAIEDIRKAMLGLLKPVVQEKFLGKGQVKQVFKVGKVGTVAGLSVTEGLIRRSAPIRLVRDGVIVIQGKIASLKRFKDDAREVTAGMECGLSIENFNDVKEGDVIEAFVLEEIAQSL